MACTLIIIDCGTSLLGGAVDDALKSGWDAICQDFADAASNLLKAFAQAFVAIPNIDIAGGGIKSVYAMSLGIAALIASILLIGQVVRTAFTHDGAPLATALTGLGKALLAFLMTLTVAATALQAADDLTNWIVTQGFGSTDGLANKLMAAFQWDNGTSGTLLMLLAIVGILITIVLWFELLLRNAAFAVLVATSPIAAAGQMSESTRTWWSKLVGAGIQLAILKPLIALVFTLGFTMVDKSGGIESELSGMLVLLLAVVAWPTIARFFTFASVQVGGAAGLGALLGLAAGRGTAASGGASGGGASGANPDTFSRQTEARTMAAAGQGSAAAGSAGAAGGAAGGAAAAGAAALGPVGIAVAGAKLAQSAVNALAGRTEQMAGHAGLGGANHYPTPAGRPSGAQQPPNQGERTGTPPHAAQAPATRSAPPPPVPPTPSGSAAPAPIETPEQQLGTQDDHGSTA
jgi:hypothetical protein